MVSAGLASGNSKKQPKEPVGPRLSCCGLGPVSQQGCGLLSLEGLPHPRLPKETACQLLEGQDMPVLLTTLWTSSRPEHGMCLFLSECLMNE